MARPRLRGVLLCEDREHERFFGRLLRKWFGHGKLRIEQIPNNQGAGDAWVLERYPREARLARSKKGENYALVVAIDGDRVKAQQRLRRLDQKLAEDGLSRRDKNELIAIFVPTRNVETWELWLCGHSEIDEDNDFKQRFEQAKRRGEASSRQAVEAWFSDLSPKEKTVERETMPSLAAGRAEILRLDRPSK